MCHRVVSGNVAELELENLQFLQVTIENNTMNSPEQDARVVLLVVMCTVSPNPDTERHHWGMGHLASRTGGTFHPLHKPVSR